MNALLIVDSPAVAHKMSGIAGEGWQVQAAPRHLLDFPRTHLGVAVRGGFELEYSLPFRQRQTAARLTKAAANADTVYLTLGDDLSAWQVLEVLKLPLETRVHLLHLEALTPQGWAQALANGRPLDLKRVEAVKVRRAAGRLVGYLLTPLVNRLLDTNLKVDRLGTVMLAVLVGQERRVAPSAGGYSLEVKLRTAEGDFDATLSHILGKRAGLAPRAQAEHLVERLTGAHFWVEQVKTREESCPALPAFTLSSLMEAADRLWAWSPARTGEIARILFEAGWISLSEAIDGGICPTDPSRLPRVEDELADGARLYDLIWRRFEGSKMPPAVEQQRGVRVRAGRTMDAPFPLEWRALERVRTVEGFLRSYPEAGSHPQTLPPLVPGQKLTPLALVLREQAAPVRFSRGGLLTALVQGGVGDATACAAALERLEVSGLVRLEGNALMTTPLGMKLHDLLSAHAAAWSTPQGAAALEQDYARMVSGEMSYPEVMEGFWKDFAPCLKALNETVKGKGMGEPCPQCGGKLLERSGTWGTFIGCANYPTCKYTRNRPSRVLSFTRSQEVVHG